MSSLHLTVICIICSQSGWPPNDIFIIILLNNSAAFSNYSCFCKPAILNKDWILTQQINEVQYCLMLSDKTFYPIRARGGSNLSFSCILLLNKLCY